MNLTNLKGNSIIPLSEAIFLGFWIRNVSERTWLCLLDYHIKALEALSFQLPMPAC